MVITKIAKYSIYFLVLYKIKWSLKIALTLLKVLAHITPTLLFYGGYALLTI